MLNLSNVKYKGRNGFLHEPAAKDGTPGGCKSGGNFVPNHQPVATRER